MTGIAVIIPCYNLGRTIEESVASVRCQTHPPAEILVIDDGSTDLYTRQVLTGLRRRGTYVLSTPNRGVAAARNMGIERTSAPYIVLLDADDVLEPTYLEKAAQLLDTHPDLGFVTSAIRAFEGATYIWRPPACTVVETLARGGPHVSSMFRRTMWHKIGGFDETLSGYEDTDFWLSALEAGFGGEVIDEPLLRYRVRTGSRYHRAISASTYIPTLEKIYKKHWYSVSSNAEELRRAKRSFLTEQQTHHAYLQRRREELEAKNIDLRHQINGVVQELSNQHTAPLSWGDLRTLEPAGRSERRDHSKSLQNHFIEKFLEQHSDAIRGTVLRVTDAAGVRAMTEASSASHDCVLLIHVLQTVYDVPAVLSHAHRVLRPGGKLLCSVPCVHSASIDKNGEVSDDYWRFTEATVRNLFAELFPLEHFGVTSYGNVMGYAAILKGLSCDQLPLETLEESDPSFPVLSCVSAVKPQAKETPSIVRSRYQRGGCCAIVFYHRVAALDPDTNGLCIRPQHFRAQMRHLSSNYYPMSLDELVARAASDELPPGAVAVTLDDGYLDNLTIASPILLEFDIPATFFVNTAQIGEKHEFWWDTLERIFLTDHPLPPELDLYGDGSWVRQTREADERSKTHRALAELIYPMSRGQIEIVITRLIAWSGHSLPPRDTHRPMIVEEIAELSRKSGHSIGAHTTNHLSLPWQSTEAQVEEINESKKSLERVIGREVSAFSYPFGEFNKESMEIVAAASFRLAVTVEGRLVKAGASPLLLPRFEVKAGELSAFSEELERIYQSSG